MNSRLAIVALLAGCASGAAAETVDTVQRIRDTAVMAIGVRDAAFPFSFVDSGRNPQGYSIDLCLKIADAIKNELALPRLEVRFITVSADNRIAALREGKIDLECGSTSNTRERQSQVAFAYTTFVAGTRLLVRKSSSIDGVDDLRGKTIVVTRGTAGEKLMNAINAERQLSMNILVAADQEAAFKSVAEGGAAAFSTDDVVLYALIARASRPDDFVVVGKPLSVEPYAIMMRKGEPGLEAIVNRTLSDIFASGEIRRLYQKWFATPELSVPITSLLNEAFIAPNTYPAWP